MFIKAKTTPKQNNNLHLHLIRVLFTLTGEKANATLSRTAVKMGIFGSDADLNTRMLYSSALIELREDISDEKIICWFSDEGE